MFRKAAAKPDEEGGSAEIAGTDAAIQKPTAAIQPQHSTKKPAAAMSADAKQEVVVLGDDKDSRDGHGKSVLVPYTY